MMDYQRLFEKTDLQDGGENFLCRHYRQAGTTELISQSPYPILFVLQGSLELHFKYDQCTVTAGNLVVIDLKALVQYSVAADTTVLIYRSPLRLEVIFSQLSRIYETPLSQIVPIVTPLQQWIEGLLTDHLQGKIWVGKQAHEQRREMAHIMTMEYPRRQLGDLYGAFSACALGDCEKCQQELAHVESA